MKQKYCLVSVDPFSTINRASTNRSKTKQTFSFSKSSRFQTIPAKYNRKTFSCPISSYNQEGTTRKSGASIGYGKKFDFTDTKSISPGIKYNVNSTFDHNKDTKKGFTLTLDRSKISHQSYINPQVLKLPGVGRYNLQTQSNIKSKKQPVYSMRQKTRTINITISIQPQNDNPSPAHYQNNPEQSKSLLGSTFKRLSYSSSKSKRFIDPNNKVPGPGKYENPTNLSNKGKYVISSHLGGTRAKFDNSRRLTKIDQAIKASQILPGPGSYRQSSQFGQYDGDVYSTQRLPSKRIARAK